MAELVAAGESRSQHAIRASIALGTVVAETLAEMEAAETEGAQAQSREEARSMHTRWAILELARARYAEDRPADWGGVGAPLRMQREIGALPAALPLVQAIPVLRPES